MPDLSGLDHLCSFAAHGSVDWGNPHLDGANAHTSRSKYVPVRRLVRLLERSMYRGAQLVVFEPIDQQLFTTSRLNVGAFTHDLHRKDTSHAMARKNPDSVVFEQTIIPQTNICNGSVIIFVDFAPP